jgi:hypothetical protein
LVTFLANMRHVLEATMFAMNLKRLCTPLVSHCLFTCTENEKVHYLFILHSLNIMTWNSKCWVHNL